MDLASVLTNTRFYTGIGSRRAPPEVEYQIEEVARMLNGHGYCLRSGAADGPDTWFEKYSVRKQIFLPWRGFNGNDSSLDAPSPAAVQLAKQLHPAWDSLTGAAQKLHARNVHQVLGAALADPSDFVVCWTPGGKIVGGTATAIRLAMQQQIPVFNLAHDQVGGLFRSDRVIAQIEQLVVSKKCRL